MKVIGYFCDGVRVGILAWDANGQAIGGFDPTDNDLFVDTTVVDFADGSQLVLEGHVHPDDVDNLSAV